MKKIVFGILLLLIAVGIFGNASLVDADWIRRGTVGNQYLPQDISISGTLTANKVIANIIGSVTGNVVGTATTASVALNSLLLDSNNSAYYRNASNVNTGTLGNSYLPQNISISGTITASSYIGDGSLLSGISVDLSNYVSNNQTATVIIKGTVSANTFVGDGSSLTGIVTGGDYLVTDNIAIFVPGEWSAMVTRNIMRDYLRSHYVWYGGHATINQVCASNLVPDTGATEPYVVFIANGLSVITVNMSSTAQTMVCGTVTKNSAIYDGYPFEIGAGANGSNDDAKDLSLILRIVRKIRRL